MRQDKNKKQQKHKGKSNAQKRGDYVASRNKHNQSESKTAAPRLSSRVEVGVELSEFGSPHSHSSLLPSASASASCVHLTREVTRITHCACASGPSSLAWPMRERQREAETTDAADGPTQSSGKWADTIPRRAIIVNRPPFCKKKSDRRSRPGTKRTQPGGSKESKE